MLELDNIHVYYGESYVLQGVSLKIAKGSVVALLGRNGMGKTTTLNSIIGFLAPRKGSIKYKNREIAGGQSYKIARMGIGLVPQGRRIFKSLSVEENLTMAARSAYGPSAWNLDRIYDLFPVLEKRSRIRGTLLSGGEQSLLSIARALMTNPDLILMDEPSEGLAPVMVSMIEKTIGRLKEQGMSILLVEQNLTLALGLADYIYVMGKGIIANQAKNETADQNKEMVTNYICV